MNRMIKYLLCFLLLCSPVLLFSQDSSKLTLSVEGFAGIVRAYHPVVKIASIEVQKATAGITAARGAFDPYIGMASDQKTFDGKNYYRYTNPELKIPTWYGIELKAGLENNSGELLNTESTAGKTSYAGIAVPLAKNLVIDKRKAALQQAKIFRQQTNAERDRMVNEIMQDAMLSYWDWARAHAYTAIIAKTVAINEARFSMVKTAFRLGDRPAIDTIEALAQLQSFQFMLAEAQLKYRNSKVALSEYLWTATETAYQLPDSTVPDIRLDERNIGKETLPVLEEMLSVTRNNHPKLRYYNWKQRELLLDKKLKFQELLPVINLRANVLNKGYSIIKGIESAAFLENNNKFGLDVGIPLRFSKGRGEYKIAKLKIRENNLEMALLQQQLLNKVNYYFNEVIGLSSQVTQYNSLYESYNTLLRGEDTRFRAGESSLFILNTRENKVLEAASKLVDLKAKFYQSLILLQGATGQLR